MTDTKLMILFFGIVCIGIISDIIITDLKRRKERK